VSKKRLQVLIPDTEMEEIRRAATRDRLSVGEWVRRALEAARSHQPVSESHVKIKAIRRAAEYSFPTADIKTMLAAIERGYQD